MLLAVIFIALSVAILFYGAEFSLDASEKIGVKLGLSPLLIGMLLVGFGTSLPEMFVGHIASLQGKTEIAIGSLVGSNLANMFLILGICGLLERLRIGATNIKKHLMVHLLLGLVLIYVLSRTELTIITSLPLLGVCCIYLFVIFQEMKGEQEVFERPAENGRPALTFFKMIMGFGMLYIGGELLVKGATDLCQQLGISEYIISAIFIAFGTSFPELITALMAAYKKKNTDIIVGNIIGSNLFNCAFILGTLGFYEFDITRNFTYELTALIGGSLFLLILSFTRFSFYRIAGAIFLAVYGGAVWHWVG